MKTMSFVILLHLCMAWQQAQGQWTQTSGSSGGSVSRFASGGTKLYTGTSGGGTGMWIVCL